LLASEDIKADSLWLQHNKVIAQLIERLRTEMQTKSDLQQACQAETTKLAEKDALLEVLQTTLNTHANQLSKLELALEQQKSILQQQDNAQQALSDTLRTYQTDVTRPAEPEQEAINVVIPLQKNPDTGDTLIVQPEQASEVVQANEEPLAAVTEHNEETPIELGSATSMLSDIKPQPVYEEVPSIALDIEQQPTSPDKGSFGKIKGLFGKTKQQPIKTEPQWALAKPDEKEVQPSDTAQQADDNVSEQAKNKQGKLKGFYSKFTSKAK
jgi:hypothetical protein